MEDIEENQEVLPLVQEKKGDILEILMNERKENRAIFQKMSRFSVVMSIILFLSLTITCIASRDLDPTSVVIGYWIVLVLLCGTYVIRKTLKRSNPGGTLTTENWCFNEDAKYVITSLIKFNSDKEVREAIRQRKFFSLGIFITLYGCMISGGIIAMEVYTGCSLLDTLFGYLGYSFPLLLSYSIWVIIQGLVIILASILCAKRKMILFNMATCAACMAVTIVIACSFDINAISSRLEDMFGFGTYSNRRQLEPETTKLSWPRNDENKLKYPNWPYLVSVCLQMGPLIPLAAFLACTIVSYFLSLFEFWPRSSDIRVLPDTKNHWNNNFNKCLFRTIGIVFIVSGIFVTFSGYAIGGIVPLSFSSSWLTREYINIGYILCGTLNIVGVTAIIYPSKSRSTVCTTTLLLLMLGFFGVGIYSIVSYVDMRTKSHSSYYANKIMTWNKIIEKIDDANCEGYSMPNAHEDLKDNKYSQCIFVCKSVKDRSYDGDWRYTYNRKTTTCDPLCFHQEDFCNGFFDYAVNTTLDYVYQSDNYLSYCNDTGSNRQYNNRIENEILLADEINCSSYAQLWEASLMANIAIAGVGLILSAIVIANLWISAKLSHLLYTFFSKLAPPLDFTHKDIVQTENVIQDVST